MSQSKIYIPLLKHYCENNLEAISQSNYPWCPFIPVSFEEYEKSHPKIFYVGIDTYYWGVTGEELIAAFKNNEFTQLLEKNNNIVTPQRILEEWRDDKGQFWSFICKLHLYIRTGKIFTEQDLRNLSSEETSIIKELGWGNMNSIELKHTLEKEEYWTSINHSYYWRLKSSAERIIDPLKNLIDAFNPDIIFILGWGGNTGHVFRGLQFHELKNEYEKDKRALYKIDNYKTKIIWTSHPRRFGFISTNQSEMIPYLANSIKDFDNY